MSAESNDVRETFADQLASFDDKLIATAGDVDMLADLQKGIEGLLARTGGSEGEIRRVLQERYEEGTLRKETFQLVQSMLDRYRSENVTPSRTPTLPVPAPASTPPRNIRPPIATEATGDDAFGATTIIPPEFVPENSADSRVQVGSVLRDRFMLQEKISGGSMGVVYKAMDRRLAEAGSKARWVAIKVLPPPLAENGQALRELQQEAAKGRCLVHPNIVRFIDLDREDDLYFLVMEWLEGRTLADILDSKDASFIDNKAALRIVRQIGEALDYAHSRGIVHADIQPGNVMIMPDGDAKLFDFGVARVHQQHSGGESDAGALGELAPAYSSMQVLTGDAPVAADDVFSLSCLLYRLIAGYRVFGPRNAAQASQEGMTPQRLKGLNDSQWKALKKGLAYSRVMRFSSVREFVEALDEIQDEPFCIEEPERFSGIEDESRSGNWIAALLVVAGLGGLAGYHYGYLDSLLARFATQRAQTAGQVESDPALMKAVITDKPEQEAAADSASRADRAIAAASSPGTAEKPAVVEQQSQRGVSAGAGTAKVTPVEVEPAIGPDSLLVDFSSLPPATEIIPFSPGRAAGKPVNIAVREDGPAAIIDFVRGSNLATPMNLRLEEVGFSGNRSPWAAGQFALSDSGLIHFPAGQARGRVILTMASDPFREADQQSTLRLRESEFADSELAVLNVTLEDDDQRKFETRLATNTIAFVARRASIRETDPAVQIDLVRFNPDNRTVVTNFTVSDITATEGEDYFAPGGHSITFGPGQRSARLLVPLVQDGDAEGDETFAVELTNNPASASVDVNRSVIVTILDDATQNR